MKQRILLFILVTSLLFSSFSYFEKASGQSDVAPPIDWTKTYGGTGSQSASVIQQTSDGGYALFGTSGVNGCLVKVDSIGNIQWNKTFSKSGYEVRINAGQQTIEGGYMLAGGIPNTEEVAGMGYGDAILYKTDSVGNVQWEKIFGGSGHQHFSSAQQTSDGGYILAGSWVPSGVNNADFYLVKTDSSGNMVWSKTFGDESANEGASSVRQTPDGGYIMAGDKYAFSMDWPDAWVVKTDANGKFMWSKTYGGLEGGDWIYDIKTTEDGGFIMGGLWNRGAPHNQGNFWLMKTDNAGNTQWNRQYVDSYDQIESAKCVQQTTDGGFIAIGRLGTNYIKLIKTDLDGILVWSKIFETISGDASYVIQTTDRGYAVAGSGEGLLQEDGSDFHLIKIMRANPPVAIFSYSPANPTVHQEIFFNASSSYDLDEDIISYRWNFSDNNVTSTSTSTIVHSFESPGNYNVTLTVIDSEELNSTNSQSILVKITSSISISTNRPVIYAGKPIEFNGTLVDANRNSLNDENISIYYGVAGRENWTPITNATTDSIGNFFSTWTPLNPGDYSVKVEWIGNQTFYGTSNTTNVQILPNPTILSVSLSSTSTQFGFKVEINGDLTSKDVGLVDFPIRLSYSVTEGQTWNDISLITTNSDGKYSVEWMPSATGVYIVKALWVGNSSYPRTEVTTNLAVLSFEEQTIFSVASNSTVSGLAFNSTSKELKFNLSGITGTTGYVDVCISKTLIGNINEAQVYINGVKSKYETTFLEGSWLLHFIYIHSTHEIIISLSGTSTPFELPNVDLFPILLVLSVIVICGIVIIFTTRKRRKTKQTL